jgi:hypothetical protein
VTAEIPAQQIESPKFETTNELVAWRLGTLEKSVSASNDQVTKLMMNPPWLTREATVDLIRITVGDFDSRFKTLETSINDVKQAVRQRGNTMTYWIGLIVAPIIAALITYIMLGHS